LVKLCHAVEFLGDLRQHAAITIDRHACRKVAVGGGRKRRQQSPHSRIGWLAFGRRLVAVGPPAAIARSAGAVLLGHRRFCGLHVIQLLVEFIGITGIFRGFDGLVSSCLVGGFESDCGEPNGGAERRRRYGKRSSTYSYVGRSRSGRTVATTTRNCSNVIPK